MMEPRRDGVQEGAQQSPPIGEPSLHTEQQKESVRIEDVHPQPPPLQTGFKGFLMGPYFRIIRDPTSARKEGTPSEGNYMEVIKYLASKRIDEDGNYGVDTSELVPLPFDVPSVFMYVKDIALGCYQVIQTIVVILVAINLVTREQYWRGSQRYRDFWHPVLMAVLVLYTSVTELVLMITNNELVIRKFMYYRLLSLRVLVDWANMPPHRGWFFYYFLATWALINVWAIQWISVSWNDGSFRWALGVWGLINLQTLQLLFFYMGLLSKELGLVTLNKFVERAPAEAQKLIDYTYVVDESVLKDECFEFVVGAGEALTRRFINIITFGFMGKDYRERTRREALFFNLDRIKARAHNCKDVHDKLGLAQDHLRVPGEDPLYEEDEKIPGHKRRTLVVARDDLERGTGPVGDPEVKYTERVATFFNYLPWYVYRKLYATCMALYIGFMPSRSWPFRPDVAYFRLMFILNVLLILVGAALLVWGVSTGQYDQVCSTGQKQCEECNQWTQKNVETGACVAFYNITTKTTAGALERLASP